MNEIEPGSIRIPAEVIRTDINASKKRAWLNELDRARQYVSDDRSASGDHGTRRDQTGFSHGGDNGGNATSVVSPLYESSSRPVFPNMPVNINNTGAVSTKSGRRPGTPDPGILTQQSLGLSTPMTISSHPSVVASTKAGDLRNLQTAYRSQFMLQNLKLVPEGEGVRIIFRDYRLDEKSTGLLIDRLKQDLKSLGIDVRGVIVNGHDFDSIRDI